MFSIDRDGDVSATREVLLRDDDAPVPPPRASAGAGASRGRWRAAGSASTRSRAPPTTPTSRCPTASRCGAAAPDADRLWVDLRDVTELAERSSATGQVEVELRGGAVCVRGGGPPST